jgi:hypothetical protein
MFNKGIGQAGRDNCWGILRVELGSYKEVPWVGFDIDIKLTRRVSGTSNQIESTLTLRVALSPYGAREIMTVYGAEVMTNGLPDHTLWILQGGILGWGSIEYQGSAGPRGFATSPAQQNEGVAALHGTATTQAADAYFAELARHTGSAPADYWADPALAGRPGWELLPG